MNYTPLQNISLVNAMWQLEFKGKMKIWIQMIVNR